MLNKYVTYSARGMRLRSKGYWQKRKKQKYTTQSHYEKLRIKETQSVAMWVFTWNLECSFGGNRWRQPPWTSDSFSNSPP